MPKRLVAGVPEDAGVEAGAVSGFGCDRLENRLGAAPLDAGAGDVGLFWPNRLGVVPEEL